MVGQFPPHVGGVGVHIHTLSKELVKQGHEVYVITYPHKDIEDIDGIHVIGTKGVNIPGIRGLMFKINAKKALENLLKEADIDIIHGHYLFPAGAASVEVGKKHGIKTYITAHGSDMFEMYKKQFFMRPIIKKVLKKAMRTWLPPAQSMKSRKPMPTMRLPMRRKKSTRAGQTSKNLNALHIMYIREPIIRDIRVSATILIK